MPPFSFAHDFFIPNEKSKQHEAERIESLIGRYPLGFREYENYYNYKLKFPDASIRDYQDDSKCLLLFLICMVLSNDVFYSEFQVWI